MSRKTRGSTINNEVYDEYVYIYIYDDEYVHIYIYTHVSRNIPAWGENNPPSGLRNGVRPCDRQI